MRQGYFRTEGERSSCTRGYRLQLTPAEASADPGKARRISQITTDKKRDQIPVEMDLIHRESKGQAALFGRGVIVSVDAGINQRKIVARWLPLPKTYELSVAKDSIS